jgi:hypothetical protein
MRIGFTNGGPDTSFNQKLHRFNSQTVHRSPTLR